MQLRLAQLVQQVEFLVIPQLSALRMQQQQVSHQWMWTALLLRPLPLISSSSSSSISSRICSRWTSLLPLLPWWLLLLLPHLPQMLLMRAQPGWMRMQQGGHSSEYQLLLQHIVVCNCTCLST